MPAIHMAGLNPVLRYRVRAIDAEPNAADPVESGAFWMAKGIDLPMKGDFQAEARLFEAVETTKDTARPE